jgi:hypothetical protein
VQIPDCVGEIVGVALLQAQGIYLEIAGQVDQLSAGMVLS